MELDAQRSCSCSFLSALPAFLRGFSAGHVGKLLACYVNTFFLRPNGFSGKHIFGYVYSREFGGSFAIKIIDFMAVSPCATETS
jgi:hypothetical protein